jgi:hypothetical protein
MKTIFLDIDGVLIKHPGDMENLYEEREIVLPGTWEKIQEWHIKGYYIVIVTARMPSFRELTIRQLERCRIPYHQLIMGVNRGPRVVINDLKPNNDMPMAEARNLERDRGIGEVEV